ncbi:MAG: ZIP family metal transporter, partial [Flavobacterium sp.]
EHGHVHGHDAITQIPWLLFISLCVHALLEGIPVSQHPSLALGIAVHHLPIAIILATFFRKGNLNARALFVFMLGFALMTPLGTFLGGSATIINHYATEITAVVIGILFHISSTIIFESSEGHKFNIAKISVIVLGIALAYLL